MNKLSLIAVFLIILSSSVFAKNKPVLGVVEFEIKDKKVEKISKHMYKYLRSQVSKLASNKYKIAPAPKMNLENMYMMLACDSPNQACMLSIAKMMKVNYLVYGTVSSHRNKYELVLKLLDVKNKKLKKGRLLGNLVSEEAMNKNIDSALRAMFNIKQKTKDIPSVKMLSVNTNGVISDVYLNSNKVGVTPLLLTSKEIKPGNYTLLVKKEGYEPIKKEIILSENKIESIELKLAKVVIPALKKNDKTLAKNNKMEMKKNGDSLDLSKNTKAIEKQDEWYEKWWVWGIAAGVVTATVVTVVVLSGDDGGDPASSHNVVISF